jgi:uncharacterized protein
MCRNNTTIAGISLAGILALSNLFAQAAEEKGTAPVKPAAKRILIVTGEDHPAHDWRQTTPVLRRQLEKETRFDVRIVEDSRFLRVDSLKDYDVVVMHFKNYDPAVPGAESLRHLDRFVQDGGGLVIVHFACGAFQECPEFVKLAGRVWNPKLPGHDPFGKFTVEIAKSDHPITLGLKAFETNDELYTCLDGKTPITVLATARAKTDGKNHPMAFVLDRGRGRVFHCALGHCTAAFETPAVGELFRRGTAWAGQLEPVTGVSR